MDKYEIHLVEKYEDLALKYDRLGEKCGQLSYLVGFMYSSLREITQSGTTADKITAMFKSIEPLIEELVYPGTQSTADNG